MDLKVIVYFLPLVFALFLFSFLHSFTFENERSTVGFSAWKVENTPMFYNSEALHIVLMVWNMTWVTGLQDSGWSSLQMQWK
jgi:hypothetical protein